MVTPMSTHDDRPFLLLVRVGEREMREYLLRSVATRFRVHALVVEDPTWEVPYLAGYSKVASTLDQEILVAEARRINTEIEPLAGVLCWWETHMPQTAYLAEQLGLPGAGRKGAWCCRDKHATREALDAAGVSQPRSIQVDSLEGALAAAESIGYPVVIKPSDLAASFGVIKIDNPDEMREHYQVTSSIPVPGMPEYRVRPLVEEYADGPEISVDCAVHNGTAYPLCLAHKTTSYPPYFIETGHMVDGGDPLRDDPAILALLQDTHDAIGFGYGVTHTEIRLTAKGPKIIEVNGRLGGDMIPYLGLRATGVDVAVAAAQVACGQLPDHTPDRKLVAAVRMFNPAEDNAPITSIGFESEGLPPAVDQLVLLAQPGDRRSVAIKNPITSRIGYATAVGATADECHAALDAAEAALKVTIET